MEYAGDDQSLERYAASHDNVVVCKSMSKVYALSGARVGYLCGARDTIDALRPLSPPWAVGLVGQLAAVRALEDTPYYQRRWQETHVLRESLAAGLCTLGWDVVPGVANFLLCHLPEASVTSAEVVERAREHGVFLRDVAPMGTSLGAHALRIAVKDARSNARMLEVLRACR